MRRTVLFLALFGAMMLAMVGGVSQAAAAVPQAAAKPTCNAITRAPVLNGGVIKAHIRAECSVPDFNFTELITGGQKVLARDNGGCVSSGRRTEPGPCKVEYRINDIPGAHVYCIELWLHVNATGSTWSKKCATV